MRGLDSAVQKKLNKDTQESMTDRGGLKHKLNSEINTLTKLIEKLHRHLANI